MLICHKVAPLNTPTNSWTTLLGLEPPSYKKWCLGAAKDALGDVGHGDIVKPVVEGMNFQET